MIVRMGHPTRDFSKINKKRRFIGFQGPDGNTYWANYSIKGVISAEGKTKRLAKDVKEIITDQWGGDD
jgi:hypothetical protein